MLRLSVRLLVCLLLAASVFSCGGYGGSTREQGIQLPDWYYNPTVPGFVGVTASAKPQSMGGLEGQRRTAVMIARAEMARMKSVQVESTSLTSITSSGSGVQFSNEDMQRRGSVQMLQLGDVVIKDEWVHPETKELFLWLVYPVNK